MPPRSASSQWAPGLAAVQRFVAQRGPRPVPARAIAYGVEIGAWVAARRGDYWAGLLRPDQVAALERIGGWTWAGPSQRRWEAGLRAVERYVARHAQLPRPDGWLDRFHVGSWVQAQRTAHAAGTLPDVLAQRLDAVPGWTWTEEEDRWEVGLAALRAYVAAYGPPADLGREVAYQDYPLGHWVQRCREDHKAGSLTAAQVAALEKIAGWQWSPAIDRWARVMTLLRRYADASGHASPPQNLVIDEVALGMWVTNRRREYRQARLSAEQVKQLEELPGWTWTGTAGLWERHFTALARYVARYGHQLNDDTVFEGLRTGRWVARQRSARQRGALSEERAARLEQLPGWHW